ncbi:hypothetical protein [Bradyrhizobium sp. LMTR 3]|uniref:hypothetical protein n=1 Tax=Bradyrhizobium sp. LMTR 3 TaxID=189873 RepID=UPI00159EFAFC|nr:hypothetical protein [Bradyrhizobium sp. LMTR 3]
MTIRPDPPAVIAMQYLMWAIEYIDKTGDLKAARHARLALEALRERAPRSTDTGEHAP